MVAEGAEYIISGEWGPTMVPGLWLMPAEVSFTMMSDALRDLIDPRRRI